MDKSWRVILAFVVVFAAGTVTGGSLALRFFRKFSEMRAEQTPARPVNGQPPPQWGPQVFRRLTEQLNLTTEQRDKIRPIELQTVEDLRRVRRDTQHTTELILERTQDEIAAVLNPEQRAKFEELVAKARERVKKFIQDQELQQLRNRRDPEKPNRLRDNAPPK